MPDTGPRAPARTLVVVRAIVPVTQKPPNKAEAMFAKPCATSSQLDRCLRPDMLSATTADSRLSMEPSSAKDKAAGRTAVSLSSESGGKCGAGKAFGIPPNRVPTVSIGSLSSQAIPAASATAISMPGQCGRNRRVSRMTAMANAAIAIAAMFTLGSA